MDFTNNITFDKLNWPLTILFIVIYCHFPLLSSWFAYSYFNLYDHYHISFAALYGDGSIMGWTDRQTGRTK